MKTLYVLLALSPMGLSLEVAHSVQYPLSKAHALETLGPPSIVSTIKASDLVVPKVPRRGERAPRVRVRLLKGVRRLALSATAIGFQGRPLSSVQTVALTSDKPYRIRMRRRSEGPLWVVEYPHGSEQSFTGLSLKLEAEGLSARGQRLPSKVRLVAAQGSRFDMVAELPIEEYVLGVVPAEMPVGWPQEALKAQAVASRSYVLNLLRSSKQANFDVEADVYDQVFDLNQWQALTSSQRKKLLHVLRETRGQVLVSSKGGYPLLAHYHSDCGGRTALAQEVWGGKTSSPSVGDAFCPQSHEGRWELRFHHVQLQEKLRKALELPRGLPLKVFEVQEHSESGRVKSLRTVWGDKGLEKKLSAQELRRIMGFTKMRSTQFSLHHRANHWSLVGRGNGHGVGMCQWGAGQMARRGANYRQILSKYYGSEVRVKTLTWK